MMPVVKMNDFILFNNEVFFFPCVLFAFLKQHRDTENNV